MTLALYILVPAASAAWWQAFGYRLKFEMSGGSRVEGRACVMVRGEP